MFSKALPFLIAFLLVVLLGCEKDEMQAIDSLDGVWQIVEMTSIYGDFRDNGFTASETIFELEPWGLFEFRTDVANFDFMRNDTLYIGSAPWNLTAEKVNEGFTRVNKFTLTIEDHFLFDVQFEDNTKNAEKNAKKMTLIEAPTSGFGVLIEMLLEKR